MTTPVHVAGDVRAAFVEYAATGDRALRDRLVEMHLDLAGQLARRFSHRGESYDDLVQVASIALIKAVERFDPGRGVEFGTFATPTIIGELKRHFRDRGWAVRAPRRLQELYLELGHLHEELSHEIHRPATVQELARSAGVSEEQVLEALEAGRSYRSTSLDDPGRDDEPLVARLGAVDPGYTGADDRLLLGASLAALPERERTIVRLRFVDGLTQSEIADRVGISQMHVSRLLAASLARLREDFGPDA